MGMMMTKREIANKKKALVKLRDQRGMLTFDDIQSLAGDFFTRHVKIPNNRGGESVPRQFDITYHELEDMRREQGNKDGFVNPYKRQRGLYAALVQALYELGPNVWHRFDEVKSKVRTIMMQISTRNGMDAWEQFTTRIPRAYRSPRKRKLLRINGIPKNSQADHRLKHCLSVLQRKGGMSPYGRKLARACASIDDVRINGIPEVYRLRTDFKRYEDVTTTQLIFTGKKGRSEAMDVLFE